MEGRKNRNLWLVFFTCCFILFSHTSSRMAENKTVTKAKQSEIRGDPLHAPGRRGAEDLLSRDAAAGVDVGGAGDQGCPPLTPRPHHWGPLVRGRHPTCCRLGPVLLTPPTSAHRLSLARVFLPCHPFGVSLASLGVGRWGGSRVCDVTAGI